MITRRSNTTRMISWLRRRLPSGLLLLFILILTVNGSHGVSCSCSSTKPAFMTILGGKKTFNHLYNKQLMFSSGTSFTSVRTISRHRNHALFYSSSSSSSENKEHQDNEEDDKNMEEQNNTANNHKGKKRQTNEAKRLEAQRKNKQGACDLGVPEEMKGSQTPVDWRSIRAQLVSYEQQQQMTKSSLSTSKKAQQQQQPSSLVPSSTSSSTQFCIPVFRGTNQNNDNKEQIRKTSHNNKSKKKKKKPYHRTSTSGDDDSQDHTRIVPFFCRSTAAGESAQQQGEEQQNGILDEMKLQDAMEEFVSMDADIIDSDDETTTLASDEGWLFDTGDMLEQGTLLLHNAAARSDDREKDYDDDYSYYTSKNVRHHDVSLQDQYLHKSILMLLQYDKHDPTIPVQGVLLNRPTNLHLSTPGIEEDDPSLDDKWNIWYGGKEHGLPTPDDNDDDVCSPKLFCLYQPKDEEITDTFPMKQVIPGLYFVPIEVAHEMVRQRLASPEHFWTFAGIVEWPSPNELLKEVHTRKWKALSMDSNRIMNLKGEEEEEHNPSSSWHTLTSMISSDGTTSSERSVRPSPSSPSFEDFMLHQWSMTHLVFDTIPECFQIEDEYEDEDYTITTNGDDDKEEMTQTNTDIINIEVEGEEQDESSLNKHLGSNSSTHPFFMGETVSNLLNHHSETLFDETEITMVPDELNISNNDNVSSSSFIHMLPIRSNHNDYSTLTGRLVRASSLEKEGDITQYLLKDQELYNSIILILDDDHDSDVTIGVILNLPTDEQAFLRGNKHAPGSTMASHDPTSLDFKQQTQHIMPIRYGGPYEMTFYDEHDEDAGKGNKKESSNSSKEGNDSNIIYLHLNPQLRLSKVGTPVSYELGRERYIWKCTQQEVEEALQNIPGVTPSDFIAIRGVYVWPKYLVGSSDESSDVLYVQGGIQEELDEGRMELVPQSQLSPIWTILKRQSMLLSDYTLDTNLKLSQKAWNLASLPKQASSRRRTPQQQGSLLYQENDEPSSVEEVRQNYSRQDLFSFGTSERKEDAADHILTSLNQEEEGLKDVEGAKEFVMKLLQQQPSNNDPTIATEVSKLLLNDQTQTTTAKNNVGSTSPNQLKQLCYEAHKRWMYMNLFQPSEEEEDDDVGPSETLRP